MLIVHELIYDAKFLRSQISHSKGEHCNTKNVPPVLFVSMICDIYLTHWYSYHFSQQQKL